VDYPIPANDDAYKSITMIMSVISQVWKVWLNENVKEEVKLKRGRSKKAMDE
jgi:ribosomal protein S2